MEKQKIAIIDLGTNTFHLLIVEVDSQQQSRVVHRERRPVMIGKGGINQGIIVEAAQLRALAALEYFRSKIDSLGVENVVATATSAFRNAKNGEYLAQRIYQTTGISIDIISGDTEAEYIFYGVKEAMKLQHGVSMIMDIGGGSVEFIICNEEHVLWKQSFEIGAQRLMDRFIIEDPISSKNVQELQSYFSEQLDSLNEAVAIYQPDTLVGASGTFDTLSDIYVIHENICVTPNASELPLTYEFYLNLHHDLSSKNRQERLIIQGMAEMRVDMIVVASWLIYYILEKYQIRNIRVSAFALKEGLLRSVTNQLIANQ
jgi:exopolyphosphatase/guanosine-5'-triphosphate,3'-diphosphate pyrophosphatase